MERQELVMAFRFPSEEWVKALAREMNKSTAYRNAARNWEGDFYFIIEPEGSLKETVILYMDLWHGECRSASLVTSEEEKKPEFRMSAPLSKWRRVIDKKLDPIQGMVTRQLKLEGNLMKIMKQPKAALEMVNCCTLVPTEFPE
jgi:putative sterol carrier protein